VFPGLTAIWIRTDGPAASPDLPAVFVNLHWAVLFRSGSSVCLRGQYAVLRKILRIRDFSEETDHLSLISGENNQRVDQIRIFCALRKKGCDG
jgi:hypothetical protein